MFSITSIQFVYSHNAMLCITVSKGRKQFCLVRSKAKESTYATERAWHDLLLHVYHVMPIIRLLAQKVGHPVQHFNCIHALRQACSRRVTSSILRVLSVIEILGSMIKINGTSAVTCKCTFRAYGYKSGPYLAQLQGM